MTLEAYDAERLDALSLRVLDVCVQLRNLARTSRAEQLPSIELHDRKALEWLEKLEEWLYRAEAELNRSVMKTRGQRRARAEMQKKPRKAKG